MCIQWPNLFILWTSKHSQTLKASSESRVAQRIRATPSRSLSQPLTLPCAHTHTHTIRISQWKTTEAPNLMESSLPARVFHQRLRMTGPWARSLWPFATCRDDPPRWQIWPSHRDATWNLRSEKHSHIYVVLLIQICIQLNKFHPLSNQPI